MKSLFGIITLILGTNMGAAQTRPSLPIDPSQVIIIDVRTPQEYGQDHIEQSLNIDLMNSDFTNQLAKLDKNKFYGLYCRSGNRSGQALKIMRKMGFKQVENLGSLAQARRILTSELTRQAGRPSSAK